MLSPIHLRTLHEVLRYGSFAVAASRLGYTASAVSQQMSALERATGATLFERTPRSVRPTPVARYLADRGHGVLAAIDELARDVANYVPGRAPLHIGCFPSAAIHLMPRALESWHPGGATPDVHLVVAEPTDMIPMLTALRLVDLVIAYQFVPSPWPPGIRATRIGEDPLVLVMPRSHRLARRRNILVADLRDESWITHAPGAGQSLVAERVDAALGFSPRVVGHCDNYDATIALVGCGFAIALTPVLATRSLPATVVARELAGVRIGRTIYALTTEDTAVGAADSASAFTEHLCVIFPSVLKGDAGH